jgi:protein arginine kinase
MPAPDTGASGSLAAWMNAEGPEQSVVVASRVRLARNLATARYPGTASSEDELRARDEIVAAFRRLPNSGDFAILFLDDLTPLERRILFERGLVPQGFSLEKQRAIVVGDGGDVCAAIGDEDHLRLAVVGAGSCLEAVHARADRLDDELAEVLPYAVSAEWGYLNTAVTNLGTGLRASAMLHLPGLAISGLLARAVKATAQVGVSIRGFFGEGQDSLGDLYLVANEVTIGQGEREIVAALSRVTGQLAAWEQRAREELAAKRRMDIEDRVFRALGLLTHCRYLSMREAIDSLGAMRLGVGLGLLGEPDLPTLTRLLYQVQKAHVQQVLQSRQDATDSRLIDYTRAQVVRESLAGAGRR